MACADDHSDQDDGKDARRLTAALVVISVFMVVEVIGGLIASSLALLADAAHMMTDALALGLAVSAQWFANRPADERRHFGYQRGQVLAAFVNGILLFGLLGWIVYEALQRFVAPAEVAWRPMLLVAIVGFAANAFAFRILHSSKESNINVRGALLHVVSDLFGSVAAIMAAVAIGLGAGFWVDPLLSLLVAALIARSAGKLVQETAHILLEGAPTNIDVQELKQRLADLSNGVAEVDRVQIWEMRPGDARIIVHARIREGASSQGILEKMKAELSTVYGLVDSTVQLEVGDRPVPAESRKAAGAAHSGHHDDCRHDHRDHVGKGRTGGAAQAHAS